MPCSEREASEPAGATDSVELSSSVQVDIKYVCIIEWALNLTGVID